MSWIARILIAATALLHLYIAWFEIFAWTDVGPDVFDTFPPELFADTVDLAANQGVYNLFLAVGLIWSLLIRDRDWQFRIAACFLGFVAVAGATAAITIAFRSGLPQLVPSIAGLIALVLSRRTTQVAAPAT